MISLLTTVLLFDISKHHLRTALMIFDTYGNFAFNVYDAVGWASENFTPKALGDSA